MAKSIQEYKLRERLKNRLIAFLLVVSISVALFIFRLVQLQLVNGDQHLISSEDQIKIKRPAPAPRGAFFDRYYVNRETAIPIVLNKKIYSLVAIPNRFKGKGRELKTTVELLELKLNLPKKSLLRKIKRSSIKENRQIVLIEELTDDQITVINDYLPFRKLIAHETSIRHYVLGPMAAHVTGYVGKPTSKDLSKGIKSYQVLGKSGLEKQYDSIIRGVDGKIVTIKKGRGDVSEQWHTHYKRGNSLVLTIDSTLQKTIHKAMGDKVGASVVMKTNGEILAMVSKPDFDPNLYVSTDPGARRAHIREVRKTKGQLNRAISTAHPSASTFKPLVALAGLEERLINEELTYNCPGKFVLKSTKKGYPDTVFFCWAAHGRNDLISAIAKSCSTYFYELGYHLGSNPMTKYAQYFRLDQKTQVDLPGEIAGLVPTPLWKERIRNAPWYDGDTVNLSIGQGDLKATVMEMVSLYAAIAANGAIYKPHLVKEIRDSNRDVIKLKIEPERLDEVALVPENLAIIKKALRAASLRGTTRGLFSHMKFKVAGKTGTVQTKSSDRLDNKNQHAWFTGYGPFDGPLDDTIVVGVFIEKGRGGTVGAAPIAKKIFEYWSNRLKKIQSLKQRVSKTIKTL